jgi:hypothetical protein
MIDKILLVTEPDDVVQDGPRILTVDLSPEHNQIISDSLSEISVFPNIIIYSWIAGNDIPWLIDKSRKAQLIIFNAESQDQTIIGYMAAKSNAFYFGNLRSLNQVNRSVLFDSNDTKEILTKTMDLYGKI